MRNSFCSVALDVHRDLRRVAKMTTTMTIALLDVAMMRVAAALRGVVMLRDAAVLRDAAPKRAARKVAVAETSGPLRVPGEVVSVAGLADFQVVDFQVVVQV